LNHTPNMSKDAVGRQKMWGTIAHNVCNFVLKQIDNYFNKDVNVMFYSTTTTMLALVSTILLGVPDSLKIEAHRHHHAPDAKKNALTVKEASSSSSSSLNESTATIQSVAPPKKNENTTLLLLKSKSFSFFLFTILIAGIVRSVHTNNQSMFITEVLHKSKEQVSLVNLFRLPFELGLLFYAKELMGLIGAHWFFILGQLAGLIRMIVYCFLTDENTRSGEYGLMLLYATESLKGANSSMISASMIKIGSDMAPEGCSGASQTLISGTWQGISMAIAAITAGCIIDCGKPDETYQRLFIVTGIFGAVFLSIIIFKFMFVDWVLRFSRK